MRCNHFFNADSSTKPFMLDSSSTKTRTLCAPGLKSNTKHIIDVVPRRISDIDILNPGLSMMRAQGCTGCTAEQEVRCHWFQSCIHFFSSCFGTKRRTERPNWEGPLKGNTNRIIDVHNNSDIPNPSLSMMRAQGCTGCTTEQDIRC